VIAREQRIARAGPSKVAKKPSPAVVELASAKLVELAPDERVVPADELRPAGVAELGRLLGRADDVCEEDGRENGVGFRLFPSRRDEAFDLGGRRLGIAGYERVAPSGEFDAARSRGTHTPIQSRD